MKKISNILSVDVVLIGKQNLKDIKDFVFGNADDERLPIKFYINGSWRIKHRCVKCDSIVITGLDVPPSGNDTNFNKLHSFHEQYYTRDTLQKIVDIFSSLQLCEINGVHYVFEKEFDVVFPKASAVTLFYYKCFSCSTDYLANYAIGYGNDGERERPSPDIVFINEVLNIYLDKRELAELLP